MSAELAKAREQAEKAAAALAAAEQKEAEKQAAIQAERDARQAEKDRELWSQWDSLDESLNHDKVTDAELAEAFEKGTLASLAADHSSRRIARNHLRAEVQRAARNIGEDDSRIPDLRPYEGTEPGAVYDTYLRTALRYLASQKAADLSEAVLSKFEVN